MISGITYVSKTRLQVNVMKYMLCLFIGWVLSGPPVDSLFLSRLLIAMRGAEHGTAQFYVMLVLISELEGSVDTTE